MLRPACLSFFLVASVFGHAFSQEPVVPEPQDASSTQDDKKDEKKEVTASASNPTSREIQTLALSARKQLSAAALPKVESAKTKLNAALKDLDTFLGRSKSGKDWAEFLHLDTLKSEIEKDNPAVTVLSDLEMNMRQNYLGLENRHFVAVRDGIVQLIRAQRYGSNPDQTLKMLDARLEKLVDELNHLPVGGNADSQRAEAVGVLTNYLYESNQVPTTVAALRSKFSQPNVRLTVSDRLVNRLVSQPVGQPSPVNECLMGTHVVGNAFLSGNVSADLLPQMNGVGVCLFLNAQMSSQNTGYNRGVVLQSIGTSPVQVAKQITVTPTGISTSPPSIATNLQTEITAIQHRLRIVRKIAARKAAETQPIANSIAEGRMQNRISSQFDEQVETQIAQARGRFQELQSRPLPELKRIGVERPTYSIQSTSDQILGSLTQCNPSQLAATGPSPIPKAMDCEIFVDAHHSALMNLIDVYLGGRTLRSHDLDDMARSFGLPETPEITKESNGELWTVSFATFHPVQLDMDNGLLKITLRIAQMTRGEQVLRQPATITASYRPSYYNGFLRLDREGDVSIEFVGRSTGLGAVSLRAFLKAKFENTFKPVLVDQKINMPTQLPVALSIQSIQLDDGWLQIALR